MTTWILRAAGIALLAGHVVAGGVATDLGAAFGAAQTSGKDVLVINDTVASGEDLFQQRRVKAGLFDAEPFLAFANDFVLVHPIHPRERRAKTDPTSSTSVSPEVGATIETISQMHAGALEPSVLLVTPTGTVYGHLVIGSDDDATGLVARMRKARQGRDQCVKDCEEIRRRRTGDEADSDGLVQVAVRVAGFGVGALHKEAVDLVRMHDLEDAQNVLAQDALAVMTRTHLGKTTPNWSSFAAATDSAATTTPSIQKLGDYHVYGALARLRLGDEEGARQRLRAARNAPVPPTGNNQDLVADIDALLTSAPAKK